MNSSQLSFSLRELPQTYKGERISFFDITPILAEQARQITHATGIMVINSHTLPVILQEAGKGVEQDIEALMARETYKPTPHPLSIPVQNRQPMLGQYQRALAAISPDAGVYELEFLLTPALSVTTINLNTDGNTAQDQQATHTFGKSKAIDITSRVSAELRCQMELQEVQRGLAYIGVPHTTCAIQKGQQQMLAQIESLNARTRLSRYEHDKHHVGTTEKPNGQAHLKAALSSHYVELSFTNRGLVTNGDRLFLAEFDPRELRQLRVAVSPKPNGNCQSARVTLYS